MQDQDPVRIPIEDTSTFTLCTRDIPSVVEEYLNEAHAAGLREVRSSMAAGQECSVGWCSSPWNGIRSCWIF